MNRRPPSEIEDIFARYARGRRRVLLALALLVAVGALIVSWS